MDFKPHSKLLYRLLGATACGVASAMLLLLCADFISAPQFFLQAKGKSNWSPLVGIGAESHLAAIKSRNHSRFEAGNIAKIKRVNPNKTVLSLRSDNDDALPKFWRQWWYAALDNINTTKVHQIELHGAGQWNQYLPVYSYDNKNWEHFQSSEVTRPNKLTMRIKKKFSQKQVWLARFHPYTYSDLQSYNEKIKKSRFVQLSSLGSSSEGRDIPVWTISNFSVGNSRKSRVVIHARTHPGELASSYLLEGMVDFLLSNSQAAAQLRNKLIFEIVPMLNPDGVVAGNNRVTTYGVNLEGKWYTTEQNPFLLDLERVPREVRLFYRQIRSFLEDKAPVTMALNLHSSAGEPEDGVFFFPHFGPKELGYNKQEAALFRNQMRFISDFADFHGRSWFNMPAKDGTRNFTKKAVPETWWWRNFQDKVMALSIETTYGLAGPCQRWMTPSDLKKLGVSMVRAIGTYHNIGQLSKASSNCTK
jgi:hypothetical protein